MLTRRAWLTVTALLTLEQLAQAAPDTTGKGEPEANAKPREKVLLVPLGNGLASSDAQYIRQCLLAFYDFDIDVSEPKQLPNAAYYALRKRYRAEKLLDYLESLAPKNVNRVVGLTSVDISTTKGNVHDWGILGLATISGRACVLSSYRCRRGTKTEDELKIRFGKVAVHEVGHTLGLPHCPTFGCIMEDARGSVLTTDREYNLCEHCRNRLQKLGRAALEHPSIPWPKPEVLLRSKTK
jgi:archaemetzincin